MHDYARVNNVKLW